MSSFVNEAIHQQLQARRVQCLLDQMDQEFGSVPEDVVREIEAIAWPSVDDAADSR